MAHYENHIENPDAYSRATDERIKDNARKGKRARWLGEDHTREAVVAFLASHRGGEGFLAKMAGALDEWGSLTEGQEAAVRRAMTKGGERKAEYEARAMASKFVGTTGKRAHFGGLVVVGVFYEEDGEWGPRHSYKFEDPHGNLLLYKTGGRLGFKPNSQTFIPVARGQMVDMKATVKTHFTTSKGAQMTILTRAKVENISEAEAT